MQRILISIILMGAVSVSGWAHFPILLHDTPWARANQTVNFFYVYGHPYEREWVDTEAVSRILAITPTNAKVDITKTLEIESVEIRGEKIKRLVWQFKPTEPGDYLIAIDSEPYVSRNNAAYQDFVKITLHTERQDGWRQRTGQPLEIVPLTRPYGLEAGSVFTGRVMMSDKPIADAEIEVEHYLTEEPDLDALPPDPFITRVVVTDPNGVFHITLPESGWWVVACAVDGIGRHVLDGKSYPLNGLAAMYIYVDESMK
ncbi:MAG: DUF4198 domain-containing protein [Candidatus Hinthialibacter antarcticus]|nr:DUF4198 domain-containing protein [Candidatus Hinthialibacter antarcticus]